MNSSHQKLAYAAALVVALVLGSQSTRAQQTRQIRFRQSNQVSKRDIGSATKLEGIVCVYHVFVSDLHSSWTNDDKTKVRSKLREAYNFITAESRRRGKLITFVDDFAPDTRLAARVPEDAHADPLWTEYAIEQAAEKSSVNLVNSIRQQTQADNVIICLHVPKAALSYNLAFYKDVSQRYSAERMICFSTYPDGRETSSATYAHEILHLFGAGDLYFPYDPDAKRKTHAARLFPNDVMYRVDYDIRRLNVGPFTAYRVGWTNKLDPSYARFED